MSQTLELSGGQPLESPVNPEEAILAETRDIIDRAALDALGYMAGLASRKPDMTQPISASMHTVLQSGTPPDDV